MGTESYDGWLPPKDRFEEDNSGGTDKSTLDLEYQYSYARAIEALTKSDYEEWRGNKWIAKGFNTGADGKQVCEIFDGDDDLKALSARADLNSQYETVVYDFGPR